MVWRSGFGVARGLAVAAAVGVLLSGCSGGSTNSSSTPAIGQTVSDASQKGVDAIPDMGTDFVGIRKDVELSECPLGKGKVSVTGKVANKSDKPQDVMVAVSWMSADGGTQYATKVFTQKALQAGKTATFELAADIAADAATCAVQAKRNAVGTLK